MGYQLDHEEARSRIMHACVQSIYICWTVPVQSQETTETCSYAVIGNRGWRIAWITRWVHGCRWRFADVATFLYMSSQGRVSGIDASAGAQERHQERRE